MAGQLETEARAKLLESRRDWEQRLDAIQADRRRESYALAADSEDQAVQRENDETLDALDARGRAEIAAIDAALARIDTGSFGRCASCGDAIPADRLRAQPTATTCLACAG